MRIVDIDAGGHARIFNTLAIETSSLCNRTCVFCPVHEGDRPDELMDLSLIEKIALELRSLRWRGRITTYIYNEPMRDPRLRDIIQLLRSTIPGVCLMVSTNGDYIKRSEQISQLLDAGVNQLLVNVYSAQDFSNDEMRRAHGVRLASRRSDQFSQWRSDLGLRDGPIYTYVKPSERYFRIDNKFGVSPRSNMGKYELQNRSGNIPWFRVPAVEPMDRGCTRPFRFLNINWRGDGILCCNDYHGVTNFGNIKDKTLVEIWNHPEFHRYRLHLQNKNRHVPLCDKCDYRGGPYPHMIQRVRVGGSELIQE